MEFLMYRAVALLRKHFARLMPVGSQRFGRAAIADIAVRHVRDAGLDGAYLEFGVYRGSTFSTFFHLFKKYGMTRALWAFDSFKGLPAKGEGDSGNWYEGQYSCSIAGFRKFMAMWGVPEDAFEIVPGYYSESLTEDLVVPKAAIVWVDCDLYSSTVPVLDFIRPLLQDGSLVLFDDFGGEDDQGERRALREFLTRNPDLAFRPLRKFHTKGEAFEVFLRGESGTEAGWVSSG